MPKRYRTAKLGPRSRRIIKAWGGRKNLYAAVKLHAAAKNPRKKFYGR